MPHAGCDLEGLRTETARILLHVQAFDTKLLNDDWRAKEKEATRKGDPHAENAEGGSWESE